MQPSETISSCTEPKPLHASQQIIHRFPDHSIIIELRVFTNLELERLILGFGESVEVLGPKYLRNRIQNKLNQAAAQYQKDEPEDDAE